MLGLPAGLAELGFKAPLIDKAINHINNAANVFMAALPTVDQPSRLFSRKTMAGQYQAAIQEQSQGTFRARQKRAGKLPVSNSKSKEPIGERLVTTGIQS